MPQPRQKGQLRKDYNLLIWKYLKANPQLKDLKETDKLTRIEEILDKVRKNAYPSDKRKGWPYKGWCQEIWVFIDQWEDMNLDYALWGINPLKIKIKDNSWD